MSERISECILCPTGRAKDLLIILLALLGVVAVLVLYLYSFRYIVTYSLEDGALQIKLFGSITVRRIPIPEIDDVQILSWKDLVPFTSSFRPDFLFAERWGGYTIGKGVGLSKHTGLIRTVIISPRDPEDFAERIRAEITKKAR